MFPLEYLAYQARYKRELRKLIIPVLCFLFFVPLPVILTCRNVFPGANDRVARPGIKAKVQRDLPWLLNFRQSPLLWKIKRILKSRQQNAGLQQPLWIELLWFCLFSYFVCRPLSSYFFLSSGKDDIQSQQVESVAWLTGHNCLAIVTGRKTPTIIWGFFYRQTYIECKWSRRSSWDRSYACAWRDLYYM